MDLALRHDLLPLFGGVYVGSLVTAMYVLFGHSPPAVVYEGYSNAALLIASQTKMFWSYFCTVGALF